MADNKAERVDPAEAAQQLGTGAPAATIDGALGPNWQAWQEHVKANVQPVDEDGDGYAEMETPVVPLLAYGDGPNDYIATDIDAGQVMVRDANDRTGKAWKFPLDAFMRFVAHAHGKKVAGEPEAEEGDGPYEAARKLAARTAKLVQADRDAEASRDTGGKRK
jgi:hypothetical protein